MPLHGGCGRLLRRELGHDFFGEEAEAVEDLFLRDGFGGVEEEVDAVGADGLPAFHDFGDVVGVADADAFGDARAVAGRVRLLAELRQETESWVRAGRVRLAGGE